MRWYCRFSILVCVLLIFSAGVCVVIHFVNRSRAIDAIDRSGAGAEYVVSVPPTLERLARTLHCEKVLRPCFGGLRSLTIEGAYEVPIDAVRQFPELEVLVIHDDVGISSIFENLHYFQKIRVIKIIFCPEVNDTHVALFMSQQHLRELYISRANVTDAGVRVICDRGSHLETLSLQGTRITDACVSDIAKCLRLRRILLSGNRITDLSMEDLAMSQSLEYVGLKNTLVTKEGVVALARSNPKLKINIEYGKRGGDGVYVDE